MTAADRLLRWAVLAYVGLFLVYLFLPLGVMGAAAFNASRFPTVVPWQGFTLVWFEAMWADQRMWRALRTSLVVAAGVVALSVPIGLAAALLLDRLHGRAHTLLYAVMVSPLLTPGVIIGISTLIFWDRSFQVRGGVWLTIVAQTSFIAAYAMLLFQARLARFDRTLEEAALDLGAGHWRVLWRITLPYLAPAAAAAAFLAFLQSFENYNTTLFVRGLDTTLTVHVASQVRTGITPVVNALGLVFVVLTLLGAFAHEILRRRGAGRAG